MITIIQSDKPIAVNELGQKVLDTGYFIGKLKPNYPMPAIPTSVYYYPDAIEMVQPDILNGTEKLIFFYDWDLI